MRAVLSVLVAPWPHGYRRWAGIGARVLLGAIFVAAGFGKMFTRADPAEMIFNPFPGFMAGAFDAAVYTWLPRIELVMGVLLIIGIATGIMAFIAAGLSSAFIVNNAWLLSQGLGLEPCSCFGILDRWLRAELSTRGSLIFDVVMLGLVAVTLLWSGGRLLNINPWQSGGNNG